MTERQPSADAPRPSGARSPARRGVVAVEAAFVLPIVVILMLGTWEVGRILQISATLNQAAREGARIAAGGTSNGQTVTVSTVQQAIRDYLTSSGFPTAAVGGAVISVQNLSTNTWTDPGNAKPLDAYSVTVTIPAGAPFDSLRWIVLNSLTNVTSMSATSHWKSANDETLTVDAQLPF